MTRRLRLELVVSLALGSLLAGGAVQADVVTKQLTDADVSSANAKYEVTYDNDKLKVDYDKADQGNQQGTVTIEGTWGPGQFDMRSVLFNQTAVPGDEFGLLKGLRLQLSFKIVNNSGKPWGSFLISTTDGSVPPETDPGDGGHKPVAHFHPNSGGPTITPNGLSAGSFNNRQSLTVSNNVIASGGGFNMTGLFLHERNLKDKDDKAVARKFTVNLKPTAVPEPASILLVSMGVLSLVLRQSLGKAKRT